MVLSRANLEILLVKRGPSDVKSLKFRSIIEKREFSREGWITISFGPINGQLTHNSVYRFFGHETFPCRYAWLPKAAQAVSEDPSILASAKEDDAMVKLGVGKNMVRSIKFWAEAAGIVVSDTAGHELTDFGRAWGSGVIFDSAEKPPIFLCSALRMLPIRM